MAKGKLSLDNLDKANWKKYRFDQIAFSISERVEPQQTDLEVYYGLEHLDADSLHIRRSGTPSDVEGTKLRAYPGDIIFGKRRAYQRKASICEVDAICSAHAMVLRANPAVIHPSLFPFFMHSDSFMNRAIDISVGSLSPTINWGTLKVQEFLLPPKYQQEKVAELLWAGDEVVQKYEELNESLKKCVLTSYRDSFGVSGASATTLGSIAEIIMGQSPEGSTYNSDGIGMPLLNGPTEFTDRFPIKVQWTDSPTKLCREGDILLCVRGSTTGRMNIANDVYCIGRGVAAIRGNENHSTRFLEHALNYFVTEIVRLAVGSTFPNIDSKSLKSIQMPVYSKERQEILADKLDALIEEKNSIIDLGNAVVGIQKQLINQIFSE